MPLQRIAISAFFAAGLAALPLSAAKADYQPVPYPCNNGILSLPFCLASGAANVAMSIAALPLRVIGGAPYFYEYPFFDAPQPRPPVFYFPAGTNGSPYAFYDAR